MSMQMYRTADVATHRENFDAAINALFAEVFDGWLTSSQIVTGTGYTDYKISEKLWLRVNSDGIYYVNNGTVDGDVLFYSNSYYFNVTVLKLNHCFAFCGVTSSSLDRYTLDATFIVDSIDNDNGAAIIRRWGYGYTYMIDSKTRNLGTAFSAYNNYSYNANTTTLQVAPFVNNADGAELDNLYHVLITPLNAACFADFNGQKWWINNINFALPAGNAEPTPIYVSVTT